MLKRFFNVGLLFIMSAFLPGCVPETPQAPVLTAGQGQITATWAAAQRATGYEVWYGTSSDNQSAALFADPDETDTSCVITGLADDTQYHVWIKAKNKKRTSRFSPVSSQTTLAAPLTAPDAPQAPSLTAADGRITASWAPVSGAEQYEVWYNTTDTADNATQFADPAESDMTCAITGLSNATEYFVWVKAKNSAGTSDFSPEAAVFTPEWLSIGDESVLAGKVGYVSKIRVYQGTPYVAYTDSTDGSKASVATCNGTSWSRVGGAAVSGGFASYPTLFNVQDVLYLVYGDWASGGMGRATIMKFQSGWTADGLQVSDRQILENSLFVHNGKTYLAFADRETAGTAGDFASVLWKNTGWAYFGDAKFTAPTQIYLISLAVHAGIPYVAYKTTGGDIAVAWYNSSSGTGSSWSTLGAGLGTAYSEYLSISADSAGDVYVAYNDFATGGGKIAVKKYSSGSWDTLPAGGGWACDVNADQGGLFIDGDTPYITYFNDVDNTIHVRKFAGGQWSTVHEPIAAGENISELSVFVEGGVPYVAYRNVSDSSLSVKAFKSKTDL